MVTHGAPNREQRLEQAVERDGPTCVWCGRAFTDLDPPTTEHVVPRVKGGPSWPSNEVAACRRCNGQRGHQSLAFWLQECRRLGREPDLPRLLERLSALQADIAARGGARRARPYVASQLRALTRLQ